MYFDRFDICEAYYCLEYDYNIGGILTDRPACRERNESVGVQLRRLRFRPRPSLSSDTLTENGRAIYDSAVERWGLPVPQPAGEDD